jgi:N-acetylglucosaminyldiphosphoundecaprenol N-acetyl-beta-D-mannosaminyltransferase
MMSASWASNSDRSSYTRRPAKTVPHPQPRATVNVLGVRVDALDLERALGRIADMLRFGQKGYVCAVSVHGVLEARQDPRIAQAFAEAAMVAPDGTPIVWVGRMQGQRGIRQVTGPDLMREIISRPEFATCSHFFYGGKEGVAEELATNWQWKIPGTRISGTCTPPFRDLTAVEEAQMIKLLRRCKPDIIWVGISTPRQELFMRRILPHLDRGLMFGVGAAFDFHTGRIRDCAPWIKRLGFQWLHRLMQDPRRLWRRNVRNATFLWHIAMQLTGLKTYGSQPVSMDGDSRVHPASAASSSSAAESA